MNWISLTCKSHNMTFRKIQVLITTYILITDHRIFEIEIFFSGWFPTMRQSQKIRVNRVIWSYDVTYAIYDEFAQMFETVKLR